MSASFDLATLTFNQWLLFGVIIFASLLLIFVVGAFVISSSFRRSFSTYDENFNDMTQKERIVQEHRELYAIWIGRILDLRDRIFRGAAIRIGWRHLLSVFVWIVLLICIAGFFSGIYQPDFWGFCIFGIFLLRTSIPNGQQPSNNADVIMAGTRPDIPARIREKKIRFFIGWLLRKK